MSEKFDFEKNALQLRLKSALSIEMHQYKDITEAINNNENKDDIIECQQFILQCIFEKLGKEGISL